MQRLDGRVAMLSRPFRPWMGCPDPPGVAEAWHPAQSQRGEYLVSKDHRERQRCGILHGGGAVLHEWILQVLDAFVRDALEK